MDTFRTETGKAFEKELGEKCIPFHKCLAPKELPSRVLTGGRLSGNEARDTSLVVNHRGGWLNPYT